MTESIDQWGGAGDLEGWTLTPTSPTGLAPFVSIVPVVPLVPTNEISVSLPTVDPIFGTPSYITGPRINLTPKSLQRGMVIGPGPGVGFGVAESGSDSLQLLRRLQAEMPPSCRDEETEYFPLSLAETPSLPPCRAVGTGVGTGFGTGVGTGFGTGVGVGVGSVPGWSVVQDPYRSRKLLVRSADGTVKYYSGSGILLFERLYANQLRTRQEPAVILFRSTLTGEYEELGGSIESNDVMDGATLGEATLVRTAKREAQEESCNLFDLERVDLTSTYAGYQRYVERGDGRETYRCYGVCLAENQGNEGWQQMYIYNRDLLTSRRTPSSWRETNDLQRFYLSDLNNCLSLQPRGSMTCLDAEGIVRTIHGRAKACIRVMLEGYMMGLGGRTSVVEAVLSFPRSATNVRNDVAPPSRDFVVGTYSVVVR